MITNKLIKVFTCRTHLRLQVFFQAKIETCNIGKNSSKIFCPEARGIAYFVRIANRAPQIFKKYKQVVIVPITYRE